MITKANGILVFQPIKPSLSNANSGTLFITLLSLPVFLFLRISNQISDIVPREQSLIGAAGAKTK
jgi:hypothetical protein